MSHTADLLQTQTPQFPQIAADEVYGRALMSIDPEHLAGQSSVEAYTSRARPTFLYVMYAMILWSIPIGLIAAVRPDIADRIVEGTTAYLSALPDSLYALFGTGYLGYATLRQWGKVQERQR